MDAVYAAIVDLRTHIATAYICKHSSTVRQSFNVPSHSKVSCGCRDRVMGAQVGMTAIHIEPFPAGVESLFLTMVLIHDVSCVHF